MSTSTSPVLRCPGCAAQVRPGSDWCTLCYADLRPQPEPASPPEPAGAPSAASDGTDSAADLADLPHPDVAGLQDPGRPAAGRRGKHARRADAGGQTGVVAAEQVEQLAEQMIAELAAGSSANPLGPVGAALDTKGKRVAVMVGGAAAAMLLMLLLMAVTGALL